METIRLSASTSKIEITVFFDVIKSHEISVSDNMTDNWLEDNTVINDCIGLSPIICTLSGISGEQVYKPAPDKLYEAALYKAKNSKLGEFADKYNMPNKLHALEMLLPAVDTYTQTAKNVYSFLKNNGERYAKIYKELTTKEQKPTQTRLQQIYSDLMQLRSERTAFTITTPYDTLEDMYIQSIKLNQDNYLHATDLNITLKQGNFKETEFTKTNEKTLSEYNAMSKALNDDEAVNLGKASGKFMSLLKGGWGIIGKLLGFYR